jgi:hypothetical protein
MVVRSFLTIGVAVAVSALAAPPVTAAPPDGTAGWVRPVDGPVVRPFEQPAHRYGPGHRGADLAAPPGTTVRSAGDGVVTVAGPVAGALHVVVAHDGGLRTSYSFLARVDVVVGERVRAGDRVGVAGGAGESHGPGVLHFGLRVGDTYVDPMLLFAPADLTQLVRLVPTDAPRARPWSPARERQGLRNALDHDDGGGGGLPGVISEAASTAWDGVTGSVGSAWDAAGSATDRLVDTATATGDAIAVVGRRAIGAWSRAPTGAVAGDVAVVARRLVEWWRLREECSDDGSPVGPPGSGHLLLAVAGMNSSGAPDRPTTSLDIEALGYDPAEVTYFSYAPEGGPYTKEDTWGDLLAAGRRLGEQLRALHGREPGREVDLIAHSQGGLVVDVFLQYVYDPSDPAYPPIGTIVTLASPHEGAPLATATADVRATRSGRAVTDVAGVVLPVPPADAPSVDQLTEGSRFLRELWRHRLPDHVEFTSIGGNDDVVVPATQIDVPGARQVVVDVGGWNDHSDIPTDAHALAVVRAALEGRATPCSGFVEGLRGVVEPVVITRVEHAIGDIGAAVLP